MFLQLLKSKFRNNQISNRNERISIPETIRVIITLEGKKSSLAYKANISDNFQRRTHYDYHSIYINNIIIHQKGKSVCFQSLNI